MIVVSLIGAKALYLLYAWLGGAIVASWLSDRKGYGERPGLATGLFLSLIAILVWLVVPAKADSKWKLQGPLPFGRGRTGETVAEARARGVGDDHP
jgi:sugar phosphate permease